MSHSSRDVAAGRRGGKGGFCACYLLVSRGATTKGRTYIGFTVNPKRRIRQHNGEINAGAVRTSRGRPWDMVLVVHGFPSQVQALQFEWAWQNPHRSRYLKEVMAQFKARALNGAKGKVLLLHHMLQARPWCLYPLTLQILSSKFEPLLQGCPPLPAHVPSSVAPLDTLDTSGAIEEEDEGGEGGEGDWGTEERGGTEESGDESSGIGGDSQGARGGGGSPLAPQDRAVGLPEGGVALVAQGAADGHRQGLPSSASWGGDRAPECGVCLRALGPSMGYVRCPACGLRSEAACLAEGFLSGEGAPRSQVMPMGGECPACSQRHTWAHYVAAGRRPARGEGGGYANDAAAIQSGSDATPGAVSAGGEAFLTRGAGRGAAPCVGGRELWATGVGAGAGAGAGAWVGDEEFSSPPPPMADVPPPPPDSPRSPSPLPLAARLLAQQRAQGASPAHRTPRGGSFVLASPPVCSDSSPAELVEDTPESGRGGAEGVASPPPLPSPVIIDLGDDSPG